MVSNHKIKAVIWPLVGFICAMPFFAGACALRWRESHLPTELRIFAGPLILEARLFAIGFAISLFATVIALASRSATRRLASTGILFCGIAIMTSGFTMARVIEQSFWNIKPSLLPFAIPGVLYVYSFWLLITVAKLKKAQSKTYHAEESTEEKLQPLSQP